MNNTTASAAERWLSLVVRIAGTDADALSEFYDEANRYVYAIAMGILRDSREAEEITLDVFLQVWKLASNYKPERCGVASWLCVLARSRALDRLRSLRSRGELLEEFPRGLEVASRGQGPEVALEAMQRKARIRKALERLPEDQRTMIQMAFWEGFSHSEVAERTGIPLGTVKTRIRLGMLKLREALTDA